MRARFTAALNGSVLSPELLHIVTLTQEVGVTYMFLSKRLISLPGAFALLCGDEPVQACGCCEDP